MATDVRNVAAPGISYFSPLQPLAAGTAPNPQSNSSPPPKLFRPLKLRGLTFQNRIGLSPLCQYSADDGHLTDWHVAHLGGIALRGTGFTMVEATAVLPEGRISPEDSGLWTDSQIEPLRRVVEFCHSQSQIIGIQLAHAGRKASTAAPFLPTAGRLVSKEVGGWPDNIKGPSDIPHSSGLGNPKAMTKADIQEFKEAFGASVRRAVKAGVDFIEIHNAHGYLLSSFVSAVSNNRTDEYGGSFENRTRLSHEVAAVARANMPESMPLFIRINATEWLETTRPDLTSWTIGDTVRFAEDLANRGHVDLIDVSSGANHPDQKVLATPGVAYHAPFAKEVKKAVGDRLAVGVVGNINNGPMANSLLEEDGLDFVLVGRWLQKNPAIVWTFAEQLGVDLKVAQQIEWAFVGRGGSGAAEARETENIDIYGVENT